MKGIVAVLTLFFGNSNAMAALPNGGILETFRNGFREEPFRRVSFCIFVLAIVHTFLTGFFRRWGEGLKTRSGGNILLSFGAEWLHFFGEVEAVFGLWVLPLLLGYIGHFGWAQTLQYFHSCNYTEPIFVVVIMAIASTRPVMYAAEKILCGIVHRTGGNKPSVWWGVILTVTPMFGSFITEPAAMTIAALLLSKHIYAHNPSRSLAYATLGLLFVHISVGGALTHFAAPPILMVAHRWHWTTPFVLKNFGYRALMGIFLNMLCLRFLFRSSLAQLDATQKNSPPLPKEDSTVPIPLLITVVHLLFLAWTVLNAHFVPFLIGGLLFFMAFMKTTASHQTQFSIREPLMVGFFLAGLVTHGGLQSWWIQPILGNLEKTGLFWLATVLTSFNDNAAITYLASLVETFENNLPLQKAVVSGAIVGGGLTVIANAPNPAGQSILSKHFRNGTVSPVGLFLAALPPTLLLTLLFCVLPS
ncbi:MAG: putative Na+/H+ antiporter [Puniceicoccales bacterium]|jgi:hypothetical protein|nr:putative Na+/H+ antiporter [Puniceicoccales bacterium]